jgi:hypothetical protein
VRSLARIATALEGIAHYLAALCRDQGIELTPVPHPGGKKQRPAGLDALVDLGDEEREELDKSLTAAGYGDDEEEETGDADDQRTKSAGYWLTGR